MALIPLKDKVDIESVQRDSNGNPLLDAWGNPAYLPPVKYNCRIDEGTKLVYDQKGYEVTSNTQILIGNDVELYYEDQLTFIDTNGSTIIKKPLSIVRIKDLSSKVLFTKVNL